MRLVFYLFLISQLLNFIGVFAEKESEDSSGLNSINWEKKFHFDIIYVKNYSFLMDLKIMFITFWKVLKKEGINSRKNTPMEIFRGN